MKRRLAAIVASIPTDRWQPEGFNFEGQPYWTRRVDRAALTGVDVFSLADEIPAVRRYPSRTIVGVAGVKTPAGGDGFVLLVGQSNGWRGAAQATSEDLLDHQCRRAA